MRDLNNLITPSTNVSFDGSLIFPFLYLPSIGIKVKKLILVKWGSLSSDIPKLNIDGVAKGNLGLVGVGDGDGGCIRNFKHAVSQLFQLLWE